MNGRNLLIVAVAAYLLALAIGLSVGAWLGGALFVLVAVAAIGILIGWREGPRALGKPIAVLLALALGTPMFVAVSRELLAEPGVRVAAIIGILIILLLGSLLLAGKVVATWPARPATCRPSFRARAAVVEPVRGQGDGHGATVRREPAPRRSDRAPDDDLGLFGGEER